MRREKREERRTRYLLLSILFLTFLAAGCSEHELVLRMRDGREIPFAVMLKDLGQARVIFAGETHSSEKHHRSQLRLIKALHEEGVPLVVGLEMFRADSQGSLDQWIGGALPQDSFLKIYYENWGEPWPLYRDIFLYCRDHGIPMLGLNVPADITQKVAKQGFSSLGDEELKRLPPGISCDIDDRYMEFIRRAYAVHGASDRSFLHFCEAQMVWDKTMAWYLAGFLKGNPDRTALVLAGIGHSWKRGIPGQLERLTDLPRLVILPEIPGRIDRSMAIAQETDYLLLEEKQK